MKIFVYIYCYGSKSNLLVANVLPEKRMKMSATSALVLVVFVAFIHNSFAIRCYSCYGQVYEPCNDPFDKVDCSSQYNACLSGRGTAKSSEQKPFLLVRRNKIFVQFIILLFDAILAAAFHLKCVNFLQTVRVN